LRKAPQFWLALRKFFIKGAYISGHKMQIPKKILLFIFFIALSAISLSQSVSIPAQWEKQEQVWLTWMGAERRDTVTCRVIEALQPI